MTALSLFLHLLAVAGGLLAIGVVLLFLFAAFFAIVGAKRRAKAAAPPTALPSA